MVKPSEAPACLVSDCTGLLLYSYLPKCLFPMEMAETLHSLPNPHPECLPAADQVPARSQEHPESVTIICISLPKILSAGGANCAIEVAGIEKSAPFCSPALPFPARLIYPEELIEATKLLSEKGHTVRQHHSEHLHNLYIWLGTSARGDNCC